MRGEKQSGQQGRPGRQVQPPAFTGVLQAAKQHGEDVHHEDRNATMQEDVDHVETHGVEAATQIVVNPVSEGGSHQMRRSVQKKTQTICRKRLVSNSILGRRGSLLKVTSR